MSSKQQEMKGLGEGGWGGRTRSRGEAACVCIFKTKEAVVYKKGYQYEDMERYLDDGSYEILYKGQDTGINDIHLLEAIANHHPFKVYSRKKNTGSFKYVGLSTEVSVHTRRADGQHLVIRLVIRNVVNEDVPRHVDGYCKYRVDALVHAGVMDQQRNWRIKVYNENLVNGFFVSV